MNAGTIGRIVGYELRDIARGKWMIAYAVFFLLLTEALLRFGGPGETAILSLLNVVLLLIPLVSIIFGTMYLYDARAFTELLLSQPIARPQLFFGLYIGLVVPLTLAALLGMTIPYIIRGFGPGGPPTALLTLALAAVFLTAIFMALAFAIAIRVDDKVKGLGSGILLWLFFAVVYDGLVMIAVSALAGYPIERPLIGLIALNPIDLARILLLLQLDVAALLGYTGAVFRRFFGSALGAGIAIAALCVWMAAPVALALRFFQRKDF